MNHIPKKNVFINTEEYSSIVKKYHLNTITTLSTFSYFFNTNKLPTVQEKWLTNRVYELANGLYLDGKKILISKVGGYSGCPKKMIDTIKLNNIKIIDLKFCHGCTDWSRNSFFIKVFNKKMYQLMRVKPPDDTTRMFQGVFINKRKNSDFKKLFLLEDRTFRLQKVEDSKEVFIKGIWENDKNTLTLKLFQNDTIKLFLQNEKLISIDNKKIKFKKVKTI